MTARIRRRRLRRFTSRAASILIVLALVPAARGIAAGQEPVREEQVPVDSAGRVLEITPELRQSAGLFPGVRSFEVARLFRQEDGTMVLEVTWREADRLVRERRTLDGAAAEALRQEVRTALAASDRALPLVREGRGGLVWGATGLGLGFYGWSIPIALNIDDERVAVATYLLTAAASFYLPYRMTRERSVSDAHRSLALWGATRGAFYGGTLGFGLTDRGGLPEFDDDEEDEWRVRLGLATAGSVAGGLLGFKAVDWTGIDEGTADLWGTLTDFATVAGFGTGYVFGFYDEEITTGQDGRTVHEDADLLPGNLLALAATGAGFYGARVIGRRETYSGGDVHVLRSFGLLGAQALLPVADLLDPDEDKVHVAAAILGAGPGLWLGNRLLRHQNFSNGDGLLVAAGHLAGGLLGAGLTYLVNPETDRDALIYLTTTAAGSAAGLAFTYRALAAPRAPPGSTGPFGDVGSARDGVRVSMSPVGLLRSMLGRAVGASSARTSLLTIRW